jgi:hypothetical protein
LGDAILSRFAIFRRSALPGDKPSRLTPEGGGLERELSKLYELSGYYPAYARELTVPSDGRRYFVIPAYGRSEAVVPAHCLVGGEHERRLLVEEQHRRLIEPVDCIIETRAGEELTPRGCEPFAAIDEGGRVLQAEALAKEPTVELVPDGVASVRIAFRETPTITEPVRENAFMFTPPSPSPRIASELRRLAPAIAGRNRRLIAKWDKTVEETDPTRLEWLNSVGRVIRVISRPAAGTSVGNLLAPQTASTTSRAPTGG